MRTDKRILGYMVCGMSCAIMVLLYIIEQKNIEYMTQIQQDTPVNTIYGMNVECVDWMSGVYIHTLDEWWAIETEVPVQCNINFTK